MTTPNPATNSENLCFVTIVFPVVNDEQYISVKNKITAALSELPRVKAEYKMTEVRDGTGLVNT